MTVSEQPKSSSLVQRMLKGGMKTTAIKFGGIGIAFLFLLVLARHLSTTEFGVFASAFSLAMILGPLSAFGQQTAILRFWPSIDQSHGHDAATAALRRCLTITFAGAGVLLIAGAALSALGIEAQALGGSADVWLPTAALAAAFALSEVVTACLRARGAVIWAFLPQDVLWRSIVMAIVGLASLQLGAVGALWITTAVLAVLVVAQFIVLAASTPKLLVMPGTLPLVAEERAAMNHAILGFWGNAILKQLQPQGSTVLVAIALGPREAGAFFAASRLATLLTIIQVAGNMISGPMLSRAWRAERLDEVREIIGNAIAFAVPAALFGFLCYLVIGQYLLAVFDPEYAAAYFALIALSFAQVVSTICGPNDLLLLMSGHERKVLAIKTGTAFSGLVLTYGLALAFGVNGAAIGVAFGISVQNIVGVMVCKRYTGIAPVFSLSEIRWMLSRLRRGIKRKRA